MIEAYFNKEAAVSFVSKALKRSRQTIEIPVEEKEYIKEKTKQGWTPDVIVGRGEFSISCSVRTLYRRFESGEFDQSKLPMQGKRKSNGYQERRGK